MSYNYRARFIYLFKADNQITNIRLGYYVTYVILCRLRYTKPCPKVFAVYHYESNLRASNYVFIVENIAHIQALMLGEIWCQLRYMNIALEVSESVIHEIVHELLG